VVEVWRDEGAERRGRCLGMVAGTGVAKAGPHSRHPLRPMYHVWLHHG
jgi:hypothetical protein